MIENSTRLANANHKLDYVASLLCRNLSGLGSAKETPLQWEEITLLIASLLEAKVERDRVQRVEEVFTEVLKEIK